MDEALNQNLVFLTENLSNILKVLIHLREAKIISDYESEIIIKNNATSLEQNEQLISLLKKKDNSKFPEFLQILRKTGNDHLAKELEDTPNSIHLVQNMQRISIENEPLTANSVKQNGNCPLSETTKIQKTIKNFEILDNLGEGTYGAVLLGKKLEDSVEIRYALKVLKTKYTAFDREVENLRMLGDHENIVKLCDSWTEQRDDLPFHLKVLVPNTIDSLCVIQMEYCEGKNLEKWLTLDPKEKTTIDAENIILQICNGMIHLHSVKRGKEMQILHRDLKPENILFFKNYKMGCVHVKIGDFGLCRKSIQSSRTAPIKKTTRLGTPFYASPEQQQPGYSQYTEKTDIYSMGLIFIEVLTSTIKEVTSIIQEDIRKGIFVYQEKFKNEHEYLETLLSQNPEYRPDVESIFSNFQEIWEIEKLRAGNGHIIMAGKSF